MGESAVIMAENKPDLRTQNEVARAFGVSSRTVREWVACGMPGKRGAYCFAEILAWRDSRKRAQDTAKSEADELNAELRREQIAGARQRRLIKARELVYRSDVDKALRLLVTTLRSGLDLLAIEYGAGAREIMEAKLDEFDAAAERLFSDDN